MPEHANLRDETWMQLAIDLARQGLGSVEPNPMVGCVLVKNGKCIGQGWHEKFGEAHAEVNAIQNASESTKGSTAYVSLEPCSHTGKTGPCADALIQAGVSRVVVAVADPNPNVSGSGIDKLKAAGIDVSVGVLEQSAREVLAPYLKVVQKDKPWVIAKWAMTVDGKIATASGDSEWISNSQSRHLVHCLRARVDAIMVGSGTARADNPTLTVRLPGTDQELGFEARIPLRIVFDSQATSAVVSNLVQTANEVPTLIAVGPQHDAKQVARYVEHGVEVWIGESLSHHERMIELLMHLASRGVTNLMVEGGGKLLGVLNDLGEIDEIHSFIAPKLLGGFDSVTPVMGLDRNRIADGTELKLQTAQRVGDDVYLVHRR
ncbi:bifunctional diaminohydroxyphosphoribosylaminopyrimidine deaminase/5-amino-6-(5-phosphoribosylamino)uracil reductase RibD [Mariniblastus fucicola]|uniref:Riboflavin biosynthesis protein RibD n=1 Tax=Mariniblastus fucicola TaxID=980251 RepID=A0A5B9P6H8_9BACT|nr:bifunctional diaminohydroxyphosphoribosylaminopyrimidine deaminase/5-amino-6-(5-phosphoribosylamino)uracil reductase RibD [Mariniblastus fucicola]QEG20785.1 Riboflavin biosynthesis protein RibD [Mariniblastus fucicola]